jgi:hypothetical protein
MQDKRTLIGMGLAILFAIVLIVPLLLPQFNLLFSLLLYVVFLGLAFLAGRFFAAPNDDHSDDHNA